jgi:peptide deformylase
MAILKVARMGHPVLVSRAEPVDPADLAGKGLQRLFDDMIETMRDAPGVGLAAPQVHIPLRLFVMDPGPREDGGRGLEVVVNPELAFPGEERMSLWEGCLSIPGIRGITQRPAAVDLRFLDRHGEPRSLELRGFPAAVAQHETDHLDGLFFLSRMPDLTRISYEEEFGRWWAPIEGEEEPEGEAAGAGL